SSSNLVLEVYGSIEVRDLCIDAGTDDLALACMHENAHFYRTIQLANKEQAPERPRVVPRICAGGPASRYWKPPRPMSLLASMGTGWSVNKNPCYLLLDFADRL